MKMATTRLLSDGFGAYRRHRALRGASAITSPRAGRRELPHLQLADVEQGRARIAEIQDLPDHRRLALVGAEAGNEQHARGIGRPQHFGKQVGAVGVSPLEIVHEHDYGSLVRQPSHQFALRGERAAPQLL